MVTPKLRFKEFGGDWAKVSLDKISKVFDGTHQTPNYVESGIKFVSVENIHAPYESDKFITKEAFNKDFKNKPQLNDILMTRITAGEIGATAIVDDREPLAYYVSLALIRPTTKVTTPFLNQYIGTPFFKNELHKRIIHVAFPKKINLGDINECLVSLPDKHEEQNKIASFLSVVDEKISQLTQKHQLLSQYKQGMMQKLFSQQIRFKSDDGSEFGEWEHKALSNFIIKHKGGASLTPSDFVEHSEYEVIPKKAIVPNGYLNLDKDNPTYCSDLFFKANLKNTVDNSYLITVLRDLVPSGPSIGYIVKFLEDNQYILAQGVYGFKLAEELNKDYLIHFSNTKTYRLVMQSIMVGSTQVHIRNQDFFGIEIPAPCLEEQTKIAHFLSAIDQKIEKVAQQVKETKQWKKGLLQQMFV